jgi:membrane protease YdiL (CAAX protease family)
MMCDLEQERPPGSRRLREPLTATSPPEENRPGRVVVVVVATLTAYSSLELARLIPGYGDFFKELPPIAWWIENAARPLIPVALGLILVYGLRPARWARELGMNRPFGKALLLALLITTPLYLVPLALQAPLSTETWLDHLFGAGVWPLREEIGYRGYAFGQIYRYSGLGFWPSGLFTSALFGLGHMSNAALAGYGLAGQLANASFVAISSLGLAWIYAKWNRNLWLVFFLHGFANLWGSLFQLGDVAIESWLFSALLVSTLAFGIGLTLLRSRLPFFRDLAAA